MMSCRRVLSLRGSLVTMKIETPFMTVTAQGKAQQDGAEGEIVRVINTQSNRVVEGTVTGPGMYRNSHGAETGFGRARIIL